MKNLNFTEEDIKLGVDYINAGDLDKFNSLIKEHPSFNSIFRASQSDAFLYQVKKLVKSGNAVRAIKLFSAVYSTDYNKQRMDVIKGILIAVVIFTAIISIALIPTSKKQTVRNIDYIKDDSTNLCFVKYKNSISNIDCSKIPKEYLTSDK